MTVILDTGTTTLEVAKCLAGISGLRVLTSSLAIAGIYRFSGRYALNLQYRMLWVDFEDGNPRQPGYFAYDTVTHGPIVGFRVDF